MKKLFGLFLSFALSLCAITVTVNAGYIEDFDNTGAMAVLFDFEDGSYKMRFSSSEVTWQKDPKHALTYFCGSWSSGNVVENPVKTATNAEGSIVNSSDKTWNFSKGNTDHWQTGGGNILHVLTENGQEPIILENGVTYKFEFDYMVESTHTLEPFANSNNTTVAALSETSRDYFEWGYGYNTANSSGFHPLSTPYNVIDTFFSYKKTENELGTFKGAGGKTQQVGNWYHAEYTFTPTGMAELDFSQEGIITPSKNAPFLVIYKSVYAGTSVHMDNIKLTRQIEGNINAMGGTIDNAVFKGFVGDKTDIQRPKRYGYDFAGWYKDGGLTEKFTSETFTADLHKTTLFASWDSSKIGFESYAPASNNTLGSKFTQSSDRAASGKYSLRYKYSKAILDIERLTGRTGNDNMFTVKPLEKNGMYKISFKYYLEPGSADVIIYPVTVGTRYNDSNTYKAYNTSGVSITLTADDAGEWKTHSIYFTTDMLSGGNNIGLHAHALANVGTTLYFDDVTVSETNGGARLTVNATDGTINGKKSEELFVDYGSAIDFEGLNYDGYSVEGYYYNAELTDRVKSNAFVAALADKTLYVKWSKTDNLEYYKYKNALIGDFVLSRDFAKSFKQSLKLDLSKDKNKGTLSGAPVGTVAQNTTYVIEFYYYVSANTSAEIKPVIVDSANNVLKSNFEGFSVNGVGTSGWKKASVVLLTGALNEQDGLLALAGIPAAQTDVNIYFDDITVTKLESDQRCVIFDTVAINGERVATIGTYSSTVNFPVSPAMPGKTFGGWYHEPTFKNKYNVTTYSSSYAVYAKMNDASSSSVTGDVDGNGVVNTIDLALLKKYLAGHSVSVSVNCDVDDNGYINSVDLVKLYILIA